MRVAIVSECFLPVVNGVTSWAIAELRARGVPRVHPWARGVDAARFTPRKRCAALRARLAPRGEVLVGYVGRLAPEKHVHRLAALADLPGVRLVVVGAGPSEARRRAAAAGPGGARPLRRDGAPVGPAPHLVDGRRRTDRPLRRRAR